MSAAERGFEMVSPPDKNGSDVVPFIGDTVGATDGNAAIFSSTGAFGDANQSPPTLHYFAVRGARGWSSSLQAPRSTDGSGEIGQVQPQIVSRDLRKHVLTGWSEGIASAGAPGRLYLSADGALQALTPFFPRLTPLMAGASIDFRHLVFESSNAMTPDATIDQPDGNTSVSLAANVYESVDGRLRLVNILPDGTPAPGGAFTGYYPGGASLGGASQPSLTQDQNVVSADGRRIFWASVPDGRLYVRIDGSRTVEVSASQRTPVDPAGQTPAEFRHATPSGGHVFFTSSELLTNESGAAGDGTRHLYRFDTISRELIDVTANDAGVAPDVQGVIGVGDDGATVYFATLGHLTPEGAANAQTDAFGLPRPQVYRWSREGLRYVTTMATFFEDSTEAANWWMNDLGGAKPSRVSHDGRIVLLRSMLPLTGPTGDTQQIYRYDADADVLACVSCPADGAEPMQPSLLGIQATSVFANPYLRPRSTTIMSRDGSRVFFQTEQTLDLDDVNGRLDVYEWTRGGVALISTGRSRYPSYLANSTPSGDDVFIVTRERLVPSDTDNNADLYDARVGGGFPVPPATQPCAGDACQGALGDGPHVPAPATETDSGRGNDEGLPAPAPGSLSVARLSRRERRRFAQRGTAVLRVQSTRSGIVAVVVRTRIDGRRSVVARASGNARAGRPVRLAVALSRKARRVLHDRRRLRLTLDVQQTGSRSRTMTIHLRAGRR